MWDVNYVCNVPSQQYLHWWFFVVVVVGFFVCLFFVFFNNWGMETLGAPLFCFFVFLFVCFGLVLFQSHLSWQ